MSVFSGFGLLIGVLVGSGVMTPSAFIGESADEAAEEVVEEAVGEDSAAVGSAPVDSPEVFSEVEFSKG